LAHPNRHRGDEQEFRQIGRDIPEFAGAYLDGDVVSVGVTDTAQGPASAARVLASLARSHYRPKNGRWLTRLVQSDYSFEDLATWRDAVADRLYGLAGFVFLDHDEHLNRITIGMSSSQNPGEVQQLMVTSGVPADAFAIIAAKLPTLTADLAASRYRPLLGGFVAGPAACTLNVVAYWGQIGSGQYVELQASHCSARTKEADYGPMAQPWHGVNFGQEILDTPGYQCGWLDLSKCREADVSAYRLDGLDVLNGETGYILGAWARTLSSSPGGIGSKVLDDANPYFPIWGEAEPYVGAPLNKVGATTGWTTGTVGRTCYDQANGGNRLFVCQTESYDLNADNGDSGSPVFYLFDGPYYGGLVWATEDTLGTTAIFSSAQQIRQELGSRPLWFS